MLLRKDLTELFNLEVGKYFVYEYNPGEIYLFLGDKDTEKGDDSFAVQRFASWWHHDKKWMKNSPDNRIERSNPIAYVWVVEAEEYIKQAPPERELRKAVR